MPVLVQFGAGNIGRGFIAPTFTAAGWTVVFVDIDRPRIAVLRKRGEYQVTEVDNVGERVVEVRPVQGIDARDLAAVTAAVATCDLAATAVGLAALTHLAPALAGGLERRLASGRPLDVLVCENGAQAATLLRTAVLAALPAARREDGDRLLGTVRTSIGRMIPAGAGGDRLDLRVEPYATLPVEAAAFRGPVPVLANLEALADFDLAVEQKLYLHNLTHACLAYAGHRRGLATIPDCMADAELVAGARAAGAEVCAALAKAHAGNPAELADVRAQCDALAADLFRRFANRALNDPVARVARDPLRKLAGDDRLIGAARLCLCHAVMPNAIARHIVHACRYSPAADEPGADVWRAHQATGLRAHLIAVAGLSADEPLLALVLLAEHRLAAAETLRAAGLALRDDEIDAITITDHGLGRFAEFGMASHVYVDSSRCTARELVLLPGQCCPEHRYPSAGTEVTVRCRQGEIHLFVPGQSDDGSERTAALARLPADKHATVTVFKHLHLRPGDQHMLTPNTPQWFVAGVAGAILSEFASGLRAHAAVYTDPAIGGGGAAAEVAG